MVKNYFTNAQKKVGKNSSNPADMRYSEEDSHEDYK